MGSDGNGLVIGGNGNGVLHLPEGRTAEDYLDMFVVAAYEGVQITIEEELLTHHGRTHGRTAADARREANQYRGSLRDYRDQVRKSGRRSMWLWGASSNTAVDATTKGRTVRELEDAGAIMELDSVIFQMMLALARVVVRIAGPPAGVHGNALSGWMNIWDLVLKVANEEKGQDLAPVRSIPLRWAVPTDQVREQPTKRNGKADRCPPTVLLTLRTETFALSGKPKIILISPGGLGSRFELFWALLGAQLRSLLITAFSGWDGPLPRIGILDYYADEELAERNLTRLLASPHFTELGISTPRLFDEHLAGVGLTRADIGAGPGWHHDGLIRDLQRMVAGGTMKQSEIDHVVVVRVGDGKNIDLPGRIGPKVLHFGTPAESGAYLLQAYHEAA